MIDLHIHTTASDSIHSPQEVMRIAKSKGLGAIAITDHDTVAGVKEIMNSEGIEIVPGIELSTWHEGTQLHILGYYIDVESEELQKALDYLVEKREERAIKIIEKLNEQGIDLQIEEIEHTGVIGRPNIARALIKKGTVKDIPEAFNKYLGSNGSAFIPKTLLSFDQSIKAIKKAGGVAVLAHPGEIKGDVMKMMMVALEKGIDGIELYHPSNDETMREKIRAFCEENDLLITGGSDCHGKKPKKEMGIEEIPESLLIELKKRKDP